MTRTGPPSTAPPTVLPRTVLPPTASPPTASPPTELPPTAPPPGRLLVLPMPDGQRVVALVAGEADLDSAPRLREGLLGCLAYRPRSLVVDVTDLSFCDLHGLDALVRAVMVAQRSGVSVTLRPSPQLSWLITAVQEALKTDGQPNLDPLGCPSSRPTSTRDAS